MFILSVRFFLLCFQAVSQHSNNPSVFGSRYGLMITKNGHAIGHKYLEKARDHNST